MGDVRMQALPSLKDVLTPATEGSVTIQGFATKGSRTLAVCHCHFSLYACSQCREKPLGSTFLNNATKCCSMTWKQCTWMNLASLFTTKRSGALAPP